jgi:mannitol 2-dehydrogenase
MVRDVEPYELMKLRLLNASHQAIGHLGLLGGFTLVHEVCREPAYADFVLGYMLDEAAPTLRPVPGVDIEQYCGELIGRFSSTAVLDPLGRLVTDASARIPKFLLPVVRERLALGGEVRRCAVVVAAWALDLLGRSESGAPLPVQDLRKADLVDAARRDAQVPGSFLDLGDVFGDLGEAADFRAAYTAARASLVSHGVVATLRGLGRPGAR